MHSGDESQETAGEKQGEGKRRVRFFSAHYREWTPDNIAIRRAFYMTSVAVVLAMPGRSSQARMVFRP